MKHCTGCQAEKPLTDFAKKGNGVQSRCKVCTRKASKQHYTDNKEYYLTKAAKRNKEVRKEQRTYVWNYLSKNPCVDCGETNPIVLEFDHVRGTKVRGVSEMVREYLSLETLKTEIEKCDVRCANCHRIKTAKDRGYWSDFMPT